MDKQVPLKNKGLVTRSIEAYRIPIALGVLLLSLNGIPVQRKLPPTVFQYQVLPSRKRHGGSTVSYPWPGQDSNLHLSI